MTRDSVLQIRSAGIPAALTVKTVGLVRVPAFPVFMIWAGNLYLRAAKPFSRSAMMSSMCSVPMDSRIVF